MKSAVTTAKRTAVLNVVGLTPELLDRGMPLLAAWARQRRVSSIRPALPAVTCTAQASYYTGKPASHHGIVGNGWYFRDDCEVHLWRQSNKLVQGPALWEEARERFTGFTCANLFGWYNMYSTVDVSITPRPMYPADGRKLPDVYTEPADLRADIQSKLGTFPLFEFWGPRTSIRSTRWIAESAKYVEHRYHPTLTLVYLPHLDYNLQRMGPNHPSTATDLKEIDTVCGDLIDFYESQGTQVIVLSEYGIVPVDTPVHINRILRKLGCIRVREELGLEVLDPGASAAFAIADHQIAHVYVNDRARLASIRDALENTSGIDLVLDEEGKRRYGLNHPRSGELVAIAKANAWFTYYYWLDDAKAPDFARTVDIHRKPGYDPVELFVDPSLSLPVLRVGYKLMKRKLGFRDLLDIIPLDASLVKGSHGRIDNSREGGPVFIGHAADDELAAEQVYGELLAHLHG
jgi:predicted AlkP superfamily pyrophosphatase or phosphodiesterase